MVAVVTPIANGRLPPQALEAEQSVLGGLMLDNCAWEHVGDVLTTSDFYRADHRFIFSTIVCLIEAGKPADALTVAQFLSDRGELAQAGGQEYIGSLALNTASAANIRRYAEIVRERAVLRGLARHANEVLDACYTPAGADPAEITNRFEQAAFELMNRRHDEAVALGETMAEVVKHIDEMHSRGESLAGIPTGYLDFDNLTGGLFQGDLIILAGRPSMGKTVLAMNIAEHVAFLGQTVAVFSLEMPRQQLAMRMLSGSARISVRDLRVGRVSEGQWSSIAESATRFQGLPMLLDDTPAVTCAHIRSRCRRIQRQSGLGLVVVDYLQLMKGEGDNRTQEVGSLSRGLKAIAKELGVPVIALSQLSRRVEERSDKRPLMSDLRDSGEIEQDADLVAFLYRDEVYVPDSPAKGTAELLIRKQRNGPVGDIRLCFREELMRFENYAGTERAMSPKRNKGFDYKAARLDGR